MPCDSHMIIMCRYLSRVDLLRQLVSSHSRIIPSIQELTKSELARRVRDRLIQEDQYELAMEVSTKCQLDTSLVWSSWGIACLRCGELVKARDKFKHCFQVCLLPTQAPQLAGPNIKSRQGKARHLKATQPD